jgi:hypothetical protein
MACQMTTGHNPERKYGSIVVLAFRSQRRTFMVKPRAARKTESVESFAPWPASVHLAEAHFFPALTHRRFVLVRHSAVVEETHQRQRSNISDKRSMAPLFSDRMTLS